MKIELGLLVIFIVCVFASSAFSGEIFIPAAAHSPGSEDTLWRTDLEIRASDEHDAEVRIDLLRRNQNNLNPESIVRTIAAGTALRLEDVVFDSFGATTAGALRITELHGYVHVTSRTYNRTAEGSFGQFVPGMTGDSSGAFGREIQLIQLTRSTAKAGGYRTNLGLLNISAVPMTVYISLFKADGTALGTISESLDAIEPMQISDVFSLVSAFEIADGYIVCSTPTFDASFLTYASVIDNVTGDAVFVPGEATITPAEVIEDAVVIEIYSYNPDISVSTNPGVTIRDMTIMGQIGRDLHLTGVHISPYRTDGGTVDSQTWTQEISIFVSARGIAELHDSLIYPAEEFANAPLVYLDPVVHGNDPQTGESNIRQSLRLVVTGVTATGQRVESTPVNIPFNFVW